MELAFNSSFAIPASWSPWSLNVSTCTRRRAQCTRTRLYKASNAKTQHDLNGLANLIGTWLAEIVFLVSFLTAPPQIIYAVTLRHFSQPWPPGYFVPVIFRLMLQPSMIIQAYHRGDPRSAIFPFTCSESSVRTCTTSGVHSPLIA